MPSHHPCLVSVPSLHCLRQHHLLVLHVGDSPLALCGVSRAADAMLDNLKHTHACISTRIPWVNPGRGRARRHAPPTPAQDAAPRAERRSRPFHECSCTNSKPQPTNHSVCHIRQLVNIACPYMCTGMPCLQQLQNHINFCRKASTREVITHLGGQIGAAKACRPDLTSACARLQHRE